MKKLIAILILLIPIAAEATSIGGSSIGPIFSYTGVPQVSATVVTADTVYYTELVGPDGVTADSTFLRLDGTNSMEADLQLDTNDIHFDAGMYFNYVDNNTLRLYVANSLIHEWKYTPVVVPPEPEFDINLEFVNGIEIEFVNGVGIILAE